MNSPRETVIAALVAKLSSITFAQPVNGKTSFSAVSRRLKLWSDVPKTQRPALYITDHNETPEYQSANLPPKWSISLQLFVYIDSSDKRHVPAADLNVILDAVESALKPSPAGSGMQTLGGLVVYCRVDGQILKDPRDIDGDGLLWVPVKILAI